MDMSFEDYKNKVCWLTDNELKNLKKAITYECINRTNNQNRTNGD